jgi:hypothetical protein
MDGIWTVASQVVWQLLAWPLAVLLIISSVRTKDLRRLLPASAVAMLLISQAVSVVALQDSTPESATSFLLLTSPWFIAFPLLCATYPDGRFVPRWLVWPTLAYAGITVVDLALNGVLRDASWWRVIAFSQLLLLFAQVYRYRRRATTAERESVHWAILGIIVEIEAFVLVGIAGGGAIGEGLIRGLANAAALPIPVAFAIGLLRPRLGNVDTALRLVVGGTMAIGVLAGGFAATTAVAGAAGADVAAAGWCGAAAVALLAVPVIRASASLSEWVTYRGRSSPDQAVTRLGGALDEQSDAASVPGTVLRTLMEAISLDGAALRGDPVLAASLGDIGRVVEEFPVMYKGSESPHWWYQPDAVSPNSLAATAR